MIWSWKSGNPGPCTTLTTHIFFYQLNPFIHTLSEMLFAEQMRSWLLNGKKRPNSAVNASFFYSAIVKIVQKDTLMQSLGDSSSKGMRKEPYQNPTECNRLEADYKNLSKTIHYGMAMQTSRPYIVDLYHTYPANCFLFQVSQIL